MEHIIKAQQATSDEQGIITVGAMVGNNRIGNIREALFGGDLVSEPAGPGWGTHNRYLKPNPDRWEEHDVNAPWWGEYLATVED